MRPLLHPPSMNDDDPDPWRRRVVLLIETPHDSRRWRQTRHGGGRVWLSQRSLLAALSSGECCSSRISAAAMFEDAEGDDGTGSAEAAALLSLGASVALAGVFEDAPAPAVNACPPITILRRTVTIADEKKTTSGGSPSRGKNAFDAKDSRRVSCGDEYEEEEGNDEQEKSRRDESVKAFVEREFFNQEQVSNSANDVKERGEDQGVKKGQRRRRVSTASPVLSSPVESATTAGTTTTETPEDESEGGEAAAAPPSPPLSSSAPAPVDCGPLPMNRDCQDPRSSGADGRSAYPLAEEYLRRTAAGFAPEAADPNALVVSRLLTELARRGGGPLPPPPPAVPHAAAPAPRLTLSPSEAAAVGLSPSEAVAVCAPPPPPSLALEAALIRACRDQRELAELERRRDALLLRGVGRPLVLGGGRPPAPPGPPPPPRPTAGVGSFRRDSLLSDLAHAAAAAAPLATETGGDAPPPQRERPVERGPAVDWHRRHCASATAAANMNASLRAVSALPPYLARRHPGPPPPNRPPRANYDMYDEEHRAPPPLAGTKRAAPPTSDQDRAVAILRSQKQRRSCGSADDESQSHPGETAAALNEKQNLLSRGPGPAKSPPGGTDTKAYPDQAMARRLSAVDAAKAGAAQREEKERALQEYKQRMRPASPIGPLVRPTNEGDVKNRQKAGPGGGTARQSKYMPRTLVVHKPYRDWSKEPAPPGEGMGDVIGPNGQHRGGGTTARGGIVFVFPARLHAVLDLLEREGRSEGVASWRSHGRAFSVHNADGFVELWPTAVTNSGYAHGGNGGNHMKYSSFQRQLNLYGFLRISAGIDKGCYYHPMFLRGRMFLSHRIPRLRLKGNRCRAGNNPDDEPNFYSMEPVEPLRPGGMGRAPPRPRALIQSGPPPPSLPPMNIRSLPPGVARGGTMGPGAPQDTGKMRHYVHN